jgi:hypothetical protein
MAPPTLKSSAKKKRKAEPVEEEVEEEEEMVEKKVVGGGGSDFDDDDLEFESEEEEESEEKKEEEGGSKPRSGSNLDHESDDEEDDDDTEEVVQEPKRVLSKKALEKARRTQEKRGVVYLGSIPPHMKPTKMRQLLSPFGDLDRMYLTPEVRRPLHTCIIARGGDCKCFALPLTRARPLLQSFTFSFFSFSTSIQFHCKGCKCGCMRCVLTSPHCATQRPLSAGPRDSRAP